MVDQRGGLQGGGGTTSVGVVAVPLCPLASGRCVVVGLGFWDGVVAGLGERGGSHGLGEGGGSQGLGEGGGGHGLRCEGAEAGGLAAAGSMEAGRRRGRRFEIADRARG